MKRLRPSEDGFSLVELMVVILVIAILLAIAIPMFLTVRERAEEAAAKQATVLALKVAKTQQEDDFANVTLATLQASELTLTFVDESDPSTGPSVVSHDVPDPNTFVAATYSLSGTCFFLKAAVDGGAEYGSVDGPPAGCVAADEASVAFSDSW